MGSSPGCAVPSACWAGTVGVNPDETSGLVITQTQIFLFADIDHGWPIGAVLAAHGR
jgi:hypothetical protein